MAYAVPPGPVGLDPDASGGVKAVDVQPILGLGEGGAEALANQPKIIRVTRDWADPPTPAVSLTPTIGGTSLKEALSELKQLDEWGTGGGKISGPTGQIRLEPTKDGNNYLVELTGAFTITLPAWSGYEKATAAQKQAWDAMITKLRKHEQEHVNIAYRNAQKLVRTLTNLPADQAQGKITESFQAEADAQADFDSDAKTAHGANDFGGFPKVELDTSADPPPAPKAP